MIFAGKYSKLGLTGADETITAYKVIACSAAASCRRNEPVQKEQGTEIF
jgi:hypothetical protein